MWRYLENVEPPTKKKYDHKAYESESRKRTFQQSWLSEFPWVTYDEKNNTMHCRSCKNFGGESLVEGKCKLSWSWMCAELVQASCGILPFTNAN